jgi:lipid-A-disaccharide synthase
VVAVLPGSRRSEIQYIAPAFLQAAALLHRQRPGCASCCRWRQVRCGRCWSLLAPARAGVPLQCWTGQSHAALAACDVTLIASGTATLEAALFKRPMVIGYNMHPWTWQLMKRMKYQPWVGLPNILSRDFVVPELIQGDCSRRRWRAPSAAGWTTRRPANGCERFTELHHLLRRDTARCATDAIAQVLLA